MDKAALLKRSPSTEQQVHIAIGEQQQSNDAQDLDLIHVMEFSQLYKRNMLLVIIYYALCVISLGILPIFLARWFKDLFVKLTHTKTAVAQDANAILIHAAISHDKTVCNVEKRTIMGEKVIMFEYRQVNFYFDENTQKFKPVSFNTHLPYSDIHEKLSASGDAQARETNQILFGPNVLNVPVKNVIYLLFDEVLHPFYVFQIFSIIVWLLDEYYVYAAAIFILATTGAISSLIDTRANLLRLKQMAAHVCDVNRVSYSKGLLLLYFMTLVVENVSSAELVPGDIIQIPASEFVLPCDVILLSGESVPVVKNALPNNDTLYNEETAKIFTLFSGTHVMQSRALGSNAVLGIVKTTAFQTAKGKLVLSILYPKPNQFRFYNDSLYFILIMFVAAMIGFFISLRQLIILQVHPREIIIRALDVITICVPPALPIAMTFGIAFAIRRMKQSKIYCISPPRVNISGKVKVVCFDKTGTLTEDSLDMHLANPCQNATFDEPVKEREIASKMKNVHPMLLACMASCHSLAMINQELVGDPLEVKMFHSTKSNLKEPETSDAIINYTIVENGDAAFGILKRFEFVPSLQRMSAIVQDENSKKCFAFVKGAPEKIATLCNSDSIPADFANVLKEYTHKGYRVIACAYKEVAQDAHLEGTALKRDQVESQLLFIGFVVLLNRLKPQTRPVIEELNAVHIRSVMVTGDNALTAVTVAKQASIIPSEKKVYLSILENTASYENILKWINVNTDEVISNDIVESQYGDKKLFDLAITGDVFDHILSLPNSTALVNKMLLHCDIFARMAPNNKMRLVEELMKLDYYVGMVGDGSNDVSALKAAHIGISLSEAEASIAAPFTSQNQSIECVPVVIREGRAALSTSYSLFKYMASYSFIQFLAVIILYHVNSNLGDWQFLFVDLAIIFPTIILMGYTEASDHLTTEKPTGSLISIPFILSLVLQFCIVLGFQLLVFFDIRNQSFYKWMAIHKSGKNNIFCFENAVVFLMNAFQTFCMALTFNITNAFKKPIYTNRVYILSLVVLFCVLAYYILYPDYLVRAILQILEIPQTYRFRLFAYCLMFMIVSFLGEFILQSTLVKRLFKLVNCWCKRKKTYLTLLKREELKDRTL